MVLLTITPVAHTAIRLYNDLKRAGGDAVPDIPGEPSLAQPIIGDPVSHAQLIDIARFLKGREPAFDDGEGLAHESIRLDALLKGSNVYKPPPEPKPEPKPEYVALMNRLRKEEEYRAYERMINPPLPAETFSQRFPNAMPALSPMPGTEEEDEVMYADVNRQLALIINVLVSIICCSVAIWIAARHWNTPQRLALSMTGSGVVAAAEIVIFSGYIKRVKEAKLAEARKVETKEIVETWVIDPKKTTKIEDDSIRRRKGKHR